MSNSRWEQYLFERYSRAELRQWARSLRYFRFCHAFGGHSGDGDQLIAAIRASSERELLQVLELLQIAVVRLFPDAPQPQAGVSYTSAEYGAFPTRIHDFPSLQQPGHVRLAEQKAFVYAHGGKLQISISDEHESYEVTAEAVARARRIEPLLEPLASRIIDPPREGRNCICPQFYPEFWAENA